MTLRHSPGKAVAILEKPAEGKSGEYHFRPLWGAVLFWDDDGEYIFFEYDASILPVGDILIMVDKADRETFHGWVFAENYREVEAKEREALGARLHVREPRGSADRTPM